MKGMKRLFLSMMVVALVVAVLVPVTVEAGKKGRPKKASISKSSMTVIQGNEFEVKARINPTGADDDYLRWEIVSGNNCIRFADEDGSYEGDTMDFVAVQPGKAKIRCYVVGKNRSKYGDTISVTVKGEAGNYSLKYVDGWARYKKVGDSFDLGVNAGYSISDSQLAWSIADENIVSFQSGNAGRRVELLANIPGTTTITCTCTNPNAKPISITYTVNVSDVVYPDPNLATGTTPTPTPTPTPVPTQNYFLGYEDPQENFEQLGDDFDLEVRAGRYIGNWELQWSIADPSVVVFDRGSVGRKVKFWPLNAGTTTITCTCTNPNADPKTITYTVQVVAPDFSTPDYSLRYGDAEVKYEKRGDDFDLEVMAGRSISNGELVWSIADPSIVRFDGRKTTGREVEFRAYRVGMTTITCTSTNPNAEPKSITYTVNVGTTWGSY